MVQKQTPTIRLSKEMMDLLKSLRLTERESYEEVIKRILQIDQAMKSNSQTEENVK